MENTSDSFMPGPLLFCVKSEKSVSYSVPDNTIVRTKFGDEEILITRIERVSKAKKKKMGHLKRVVRCLAE